MSRPTPILRDIAVGAISAFAAAILIDYWASAREARLRDKRVIEGCSCIQWRCPPAPPKEGLDMWRHGR